MRLKVYSIKVIKLIIIINLIYKFIFVINKALILIFINFNIIKIFNIFFAILYYTNKIHEVI